MRIVWVSPESTVMRRLTPEDNPCPVLVLQGDIEIDVFPLHVALD